MIIEPAPIESIVNSFPVSDARPSDGSIGATIDAAVIIATVEEPWAVFKITAMPKGIRRPRPVLLKAIPGFFVAYLWVKQMTKKQKLFACPCT